MTLLSILLWMLEKLIARIPPAKWFAASAAIIHWIERLTAQHGSTHPIVKALKQK